MAVTIGSVTEGNANAEEIKNNLPGSELYEKNKKYLQGSLVKFNDKIYLAKRNVPSDVDLDNPYYWEIFMDAADSKRVDELFKTIGNLDELETESKDTLVAAINEAARTGGGAGGALPAVTAADAGKFLRVSSSGSWAAETVASASGGEF